jgi:hypothetical protein
MAGIAAIVAAVRAARLAQAATRSTGGITGAKTVGKDFAEGKAAPIIPKTQAQINAEGIAKGRAALGLSPKPTAQEIAARASKEKASLMKSRIKRGN